MNILEIQDAVLVSKIFQQDACIRKFFYLRLIFRLGTIIDQIMDR